MAMPLDQRERLALCDLFSELGPEAPTLCEGWTTLDLAAHLVAREHLRRGDRGRARAKDLGLPVLVERLRAGPPLFWNVPGLRKLVNGLEYFIHHEDVRRANGLAPRPGGRELEDLSWNVLGFLARRAARKLRPFSLILESSDGRRRAFGGGGGSGSGGGVTISGPPSEVVLYLSGRQGAADVQIHGDPVAVAALAHAVTGM